VRRPSTGLLLGQEAEEEDREDGEEDDRLLDRHRHAGDLLVDVRRESPEPAAVDVPVVDGLRQESKQQTDWACEDESEEEVQGSRRVREPMRCVLEDRPPEKRPGCDVADVLEVEKRVVLERGVVEGRQMPEEVGRKPKPESDGWASEQPDRADSADRRSQCRGNAEDEQRRRPLGQDDVLKQMSREEVVCQRIEWGDRGGEQEQTSGGEGRDSPAVRFPVSDGEEVGEGEGQDGERRLGMKRPGIRIRTRDGATLGAETRA
jgi:hypothetical protein